MLDSTTLCSFQSIPVNAESVLPSTFAVLVDSSLGGLFKSEALHLNTSEAIDEVNRGRNTQGDLVFSVNLTLPLNVTAYYRIRADFKSDVLQDINSFVTSELTNGSSTRPTAPSRRFHICNAGFFVRQVEGNDVVSCTPCPPGTFLSTSNEEPKCTPCAAGEFQSKEAQSACEPCALGLFQPDVGQARCQECAPGFFASDLGSTRCEPCVGRFYQPDLGQNECLYCGAGYFVGENNAQCNECGIGKYSEGLPDAPLSEQISCKDCPVDLSVTTSTTSQSLDECFPPPGSVR
jgi:hypothetical protein